MPRVRRQNNGRSTRTRSLSPVNDLAHPIRCPFASG